MVHCIKFNSRKHLINQTQKDVRGKNLFFWFWGKYFQFMFIFRQRVAEVYFVKKHLHVASVVSSAVGWNTAKHYELMEN